VSNKWFGSSVTVYAGALYNDEGQGIVAVTTRDVASNDSSLPGEFPTSGKEGALRVVNAEGNLLQLVTATGTEYTFDVDAMALTPK
jgi:hypothetical protein